MVDLAQNRQWNSSTFQPLLHLFPIVHFLRFKNCSALEFVWRQEINLKTSLGGYRSNLKWG